MAVGAGLKLLLAVSEAEPVLAWVVMLSGGMGIIGKSQRQEKGLEMEADTIRPRVGKAGFQGECVIWAARMAWAHVTSGNRREKAFTSTKPHKRLPPQNSEG